MRFCNSMSSEARLARGFEVGGRSFGLGDRGRSVEQANTTNELATHYRTSSQ